MYRLRVFAGPNGSGKSSIVDDLRSKGIPNLGVIINADEIEKKIKETGYLDCSSYSIKYDHDEFIRGYAEFINNCKDEITGKDKCQVNPERTTTIFRNKLNKVRKSFMDTVTSLQSF